MNTENTKTYEEMVAEVTGRYSVQDLVEQTPHTIERAAANYKKGNAVEIAEDGREGLIRWWRVRSGSNVYEVRQFQSFWLCTCKGFIFNRRACRHIAFVSRSVFCENCGIMPAEKGQLCTGCSNNRAAKLAA